MNSLLEPEPCSIVDAQVVAANGEVLPLDPLLPEIEVLAEPQPNLISPATSLTELVAVPPEPPPPSLGHVIGEAIRDLLLLVPGRAFATALSKDRLGLVLSLEPEVRTEVDAILDALALYNRTAEPEVETLEPLRARILLAEDDEVTRLLIRKSLERFPGCVIIETTNGREALEVLLRDPLPDLCISDISMPEMDGLQLIQKIRSTPHLRDLDVIVCSSVKERDVVMKAAGMNVTHYLVKPFRLDNLVRETREVVRAAKTRRKATLEELSDKIQLPPEACVDVVRGLAAQLKAKLSQIRGCISQGRNDQAAVHINGLIGASSLLQDQALVKTLRSAYTHLADQELFATLECLETVESDQKRITALSESLSKDLLEARLEAERLDPANELSRLSAKA